MIVKFMEILLIVLPVAYLTIALSSLISSISVANFTHDLHEISRSRETKNECATVEKKIVARYKNSILWPRELFRAFVKKAE